jgi:hypothetical protein
MHAYLHLMVKCDACGLVMIRERGRDNHVDIVKCCNKACAMVGMEYIAPRVELIPYDPDQKIAKREDPPDPRKRCEARANWYLHRRKNDGSWYACDKHMSPLALERNAIEIVRMMDEVSWVVCEWWE